jgi:peptide/nickel transport system permease protein
MSTFIFVAKRLVGLVALLVLVITVVFFFSRALPGDPAALYVGGFARAEQIARARVELGLDKPLHVQYLRYIGRILHGDLGTSLRTHRPVLTDLLEKLPMSAELAIWALLLASISGIGLGVIAAYKQGTWIDESLKWISSVAVSIPTYFLALALQLLFFHLLHWFPLQGRLDSALEFTQSIQHVTGFSLVDSLVTGNFAAFRNVAWHMVLPVLSLTFFNFGVITQITRAPLIEVMNQDYILSARSSGVSERVLFFHYGLRNALSPILTVIGLQLALTMLVTFWVEVTFNWPGIGSYAFAAILSLDYTALMGFTMIMASVYVVSNTLTDIARRIVDPRIK